MRYYDVSFFCDDGKNPNLHIHRLGRKSDPDTSFVLSINDSDSWAAKPAVTIHIHDEQALVNFKNSVLWAFEEFMREQPA